MISYYKHTNGESFTLDSSDYTGFFHISGDQAYTGKIHDSDSVLLVQKSKFPTDTYVNSFEFDMTYGTTPTLENEYYLNPFDVLNKPKFDKFVLQIDTNNIICFKNLILGHPTVFNWEKNNFIFYALSSEDQSTVETLPPIVSTNETTTYELTGYWGFLNTITTGCFLVNTYETFKYFCTDNTNLYVVSGGFSQTTTEPLTLILNQPNPIYYLYLDELNSRLFTVTETSVNIYDVSNFMECENLFLIDQIAQTSPLSAIHLVKFGNLFRTSVENGTTVKLLNKYSSDVNETLEMGDYLDKISSLAIRNTDDLLLILGKKDNSYKLFSVDPEFPDTITEKTVNDLDDSADYEITFSTIDSNVFFLSNETTHQGRYLSNSGYHYGKLELFFQSLSSDGNISFGNSNVNMLCHEYSKNNKIYMLVHNYNRLFALSQGTDDRFLNGDRLDVDKQYQNSICSDSSFGLYFNTNIYTIFKDTLTLYGNFETSFTLFPDTVERKFLTYDPNVSNDLYLNTNENINIVPMRRIFDNVTNMQRNLLPSYEDN